MATDDSLDLIPLVALPSRLLLCAVIPPSVRPLCALDVARFRPILKSPQNPAGPEDVRTLGPDPPYRCPSTSKGGSSSLSHGGISPELFPFPPTRPVCSLGVFSEAKSLPCTFLSSPWTLSNLISSSLACLPSLQPKAFGLKENDRNPSRILSLELARLLLRSLLDLPCLSAGSPSPSTVPLDPELSVCHVPPPVLRPPGLGEKDALILSGRLRKTYSLA